MPQVVKNYSLNKLSCGAQDEEKAKKHEQTAPARKKKCHKEKKTGKKEKGNLRGQLHLMRCFVYMLLEGYVFTACMGTFLACSQTFFFLSLPRKFGAQRARRSRDFPFTRAFDDL